MTSGYTRCCCCEQEAFLKLQAESFSVEHAKPVSWMGRWPGYEESIVGGSPNISDPAKPLKASGMSTLERPSLEVIEEWLVAKLANLLGVEPREIDAREPFASYGLGSTEAVSLSGELGEWLGRKVAADLAYEYPTIETLAQHLAGSPDLSPPANTPELRGTTQVEPIAIIGIGCRFPGSSGPKAFWESIRDGLDGITEVPADRFDL